MDLPYRLIADGRTEEDVGFLRNKLVDKMSTNATDNKKLSRFDLEILSISALLEFINTAHDSGILGFNDYLSHRIRINKNLLHLLQEAYREP